MNLLLVLLLAVASGEAPPAPPKVTATGAPEVHPVHLDGEAGVEALCRALVPSERLRLKGDPVARAEAEEAHDLARRAAVVGRYEVSVPAEKLAFASFDEHEGRLRLAQAVVPLGGSARLFETMERGLPARASKKTARRILEGQAARRLKLVLVFDLPDEVVCSPGKPRTLTVEPVTWSWVLEGEELARGGAGAQYPVFGVTKGARPTITVDEPIEGPAETRRAVLERATGLHDCYREALSRLPTLDGVLVAKLTPALAVIAADSVGDDGLAVCVARVLAGVGANEPGASVPIHFDLEPPDAAPSEETR